MKATRWSSDIVTEFWAMLDLGPGMAFEANI